MAFSPNNVGGNGAPAAADNNKVVQEIKAEENQIVSAFLEMVKEDARNGVVACTDRTKKRDGIGNIAALRDRLGLDKAGKSDPTRQGNSANAKAGNVQSAENSVATTNTSATGEAARADQAIDGAGKALGSLAKMDDNSKTKNELASIV